MRFAYIDSQGKEVGIPSVDALQLRIELGAIKEGTMFFDASTDKWAPAKEHEIFRTLSRETKDRDESGGFVAPPPPTMLRMKWPPPDQEEEKKEEEKKETDEKEEKEAEVEERAVEPEAPASVPEPEAPPAPAAPTMDIGELTVDEEPAEETTPEPPTMDIGDLTAEPPAPRADVPTMDIGALEVEPPEPEAPPEPAPPVDDIPVEPEEPMVSDQPLVVDEPLVAEGVDGPAEEDEEAAEDEDADDFGFGDLGSLDLAPAEGEEEAEAEQTETETAGVAGADEAAPGDEFDFDSFGAVDLGEPDREEETEEVPDEEGAAFDFGGGIEMEEPPFPEEDEEEEEDEAAASAPAPAGGGGGLELERPLSEYSPDGPPGWMDEDQDEAEDGEEAQAPVGAGAESDADGETGEPDSPFDDTYGEERMPRRKPTRPRPPPPRRPKKSGVGGVVKVAALLALLGGGGYFGWMEWQARSDSAPVDPVVEIPEIPAYLEPTLAETAPPAYQAMVDSLRTLSVTLPVEPAAEWLDGIYLANASQYPQVEAYWQELRAFIERMQEDDEEVFRATYSEVLDEEGIVGDDRALLLERAVAGFRATRPDRRVIYQQLDGLIEASLDLHDFLVGNEAMIDYEPAALGRTSDPVTEAVPANEQIGDEMWDRIGEITRAFDALGTSSALNTPDLLDLVFSKLSRTSID